VVELLYTRKKTNKNFEKKIHQLDTYIKLKYY
jgi:hypothetical protein